jgi:peptide subunit release factor 1 (eRF1)
VNSTADRPGFRCPDGRLSVSAQDCAGAAMPVPDIIDEAIEEALRQGAHVDVVEEPTVQRHVDGLACLLRFRIG